MCYDDVEQYPYFWKWHASVHEKKLCLQVEKKKYILTHMHTYTDNAYKANILRKRKINLLWLYIDLIYASYIENWKKERYTETRYT